jgi:hypothetical protein
MPRLIKRLRNLLGASVRAPSTSLSDPPTPKERSALQELEELAIGRPGTSLRNEEIVEHYGNCFFTEEHLATFLSQDEGAIDRGIPILESLAQNRSVRLAFVPNRGRGIVAGRPFAPGDSISRVDSRGTLNLRLVYWARCGVRDGSLSPGVRKLLNDVIQVEENLYIIPVPSSALLLNHSCTPNSAFVRPEGEEHYEVRALKELAPGEEVTFDYSTIVGDDYILECQEGGDTCRGFAARSSIMKDSEKNKIRARYPPNWLLDHTRKELSSEFDPRKTHPVGVELTFDGRALVSFIETNPSLNESFRELMLRHLKADR